MIPMELMVTAFKSLSVMIVICSGVIIKLKLIYPHAKKHGPENKQLTT